MKSDKPTVSVYIHFPWCLQKCPYCDFVSYATDRASIDHERYADALVSELASWRGGGAVVPGILESRRLGSVFFGGGTPSLWKPSALGRVLRAVTDAFEERGDVEVTVECNPSSLDEEVARALVDVGVFRLSIGVQAFEDERLRFLGRLHGGQGAKDALSAAVRAGVPRVSGDLIYAVAGESAEQAAAEARTVVELGATHVSAYSLTIEPRTQFGELARRGRLPLADDGAMVESFFAIDEALGSLGLRHYEVSNYARPGEESRHNLGYWRGDDYLGLGCAAYGAVSAGGAAVRYRNQTDPKRYMAAALGEPGAPRVVAETEPLEPETRLRERIMLGLRIAEGFDLARAAREVGAEALSAERLRSLDRLEQRGRLRRDGDRLSVPRDAWIWVDDTAAALF